MRAHINEPVRREAHALLADLLRLRARIFLLDHLSQRALQVCAHAVLISCLSPLHESGAGLCSCSAD